MEDWGLWLIVLVFLIASGLVWFAGTRLSRYTDALAKKTGIADVIMGTLLLGGVTSLPEVVTTITASTMGNASIALNNLFGGVALQVTILAIGDFFVRRQAVTSFIQSPVVQMQGLVGVLLLGVSACVILVGDYALGRISIGSILILIVFITGFYLVNYLQSIHWWMSDADQRGSFSQARENSQQKIQAQRAQEEEKKEERETVQSFRSMLKTRLFLYLVACAVLILVAGYSVVYTGQFIAERTGLGSNLVGALLIALSTSLPELSTTISSMRRQQYRLAFSNIFGTNIFTIGFVFLADVCYAPGPILNEVGDFSLFGALAGILLTTIYIAGLSLRLKKTVMHAGIDSLMVLLAYLAAIVFMSNLG